VDISVVILAAGQGTRMRSKLPKVLHPLAKKPMLQHVIDAALPLSPAKIHVVIGHGAEQVKSAIKGDVNWVLQSEQKGTGHAVAQAIPDVSPDSTVLVLYGDVPLTKTSTLEKLVNSCQHNCYSLLTVNLDNPTGYGRIVRDD
jgi:bifunctional UDP-N-acetylglucosamine pyrophosphorylase/glucosamine-1-phosphate N-acetyltransferase